MEIDEVMSVLNKLTNLKNNYIGILLAMGGLCMGCFACAVIETGLTRSKLNSEIEIAAQIRDREPSFTSVDGTGGDIGFARRNPFKADVRKTQGKNTQTGSNVTKSTNLDSIVLIGTLPEIGAWIKDANGINLYLEGQEVSGYKLADVRYNSVHLLSGTQRHTLYLTLSDVNRAKSASNRNSRTRGRRTVRAQQPQRTQAANNTQSGNIDFSGIEAATEEQEGAIPRELVNTLLMNPYDELAKIRMIPTEDSSGMRMERLADDSILAKVGVKQGDVISAINGVSVSNVADASNAFNSLVSGSRFDVTVIRNGAPVQLKYQVK